MKLEDHELDIVRQALIQYRKLNLSPERNREVLRLNDKILLNQLGIEA